LNYANLNNTDEGMKYAIEAHQLAEKLGWKRGIALALIRKGNNYPVFSDSANKFGSYREALRLFEELKDKEGVARVAGNTGSAYYTLAEYSKSLEYFKKQQELATEIGSKPLAPFAVKGIANIYFIIGNYPESLKEYFALLKISEVQKIKQHGKRAETIIKQLQEHTRAGTADEYFDENKS
jgi:tetratricopeptide (TPR) repeat protein